MATDDEKAARLAAALRENLARRKQRARAVADDATRPLTAEDAPPPLGADDGSSPPRR